MDENVNLNGKTRYETVWFQACSAGDQGCRRRRRADAVGVGRPCPVGGPFAGFDGIWSGNGTVALSDGTTERIRCKADYKVNGSGPA